MQLKRSQTMKRAYEFAAARANGSSEAGRFLVLNVAPLPQGDEVPSRFGIIATKRVGGAVVRNLVRRRIREILRAHGEPFSKGRYVVVVARNRSSSASYERLEKEFVVLQSRLIRSV